LSGPEIARRLTAGGRAQRVLMLTADAAASLTDSMRQSGIIAVLVKPVEWELLSTHIAAVAETAAPPAIAPAITPEVSPNP
jgi:AmiR/NasT family two-component response regulator